MHRKPNVIITRANVIAHYVIRLAVFALVTAMVAMLAMVTTGQYANAAVRTASPSQRACQAFTTWERHPTRHNLEVLVTGSFTVPGKYLGADIAQLYADIEAGSAKYVSDDKQYVYEDCHNGSGL